MSSKLRKQELYHLSKLTKTIEIPILQVGNNLDEVLYDKLSTLLDGKCNVEGYFKKNSIKLLEYSSGKICRGDHISFTILFTAQVCLPVEGMIVKCVVENITKAGIKATTSYLEDNPLVVFIIRDHFSQDEYFNLIKINDTITVRFIGVRYEINDDKIYVIGELIKPKLFKVK